MKQIILMLLIGSVFLTACTGTPPLTPPTTDSVSKTVTPSPLPSSTTPTITVTPLPTIPTFTPTFDVSTIVTVTPAPKAECPPINPYIQLDFNFTIYENDGLENANKKTLEFLNKGGSPESIIKKIRGTQYLLTNANPETRALNTDVTGDGTPELLIAPTPYASIFGCKDGKYQLIATFLSESSQDMDFRSITDINNNGIPEIYIYKTECVGGRCNILDALEWDGSKFQDVILYVH